MSCAKGLHPAVPPGEKCRECQRVYDRAYYQSERGKESHRRAQAKYAAESMTGVQYNLRLLKHRRYKALRQRERRRNSGSLSE